MIKRTILATVIALITASVIALPALAASYYITNGASFRVKIQRCSS